MTRDDARRTRCGPEVLQDFDDEARDGVHYSKPMLLVSIGKDEERRHGRVDELIGQRPVCARVSAAKRARACLLARTTPGETRVKVDEGDVAEDGNEHENCILDVLHRETGRELAKRDVGVHHGRRLWTTACQ